MLTRKQWRASQVLERVAKNARVQIDAEHRKPAEGNYCAVMFACGKNPRLMRRAPNTLFGWLYADNGAMVGG